MLFIQAAAGDSGIAGQGLFTTETIRKGTIVSIDVVDVLVVDEQQYIREQGEGNQAVIRNGVRWVGPYFQYALDSRLESYFNHSTDSNVLYHCGICFAKRDIESGEELTVNYTYFLSEHDVERFIDVATGKPVIGLPAREALIASAKELLELLVP